MALFEKNLPKSGPPLRFQTNYSEERCAKKKLPYGLFGWGTDRSETQLPIPEARYLGAKSQKRVFARFQRTNSANSPICLVKP